MRFAVAASVAGLAAFANVAQAGYGAPPSYGSGNATSVMYTTEVMTQYTTYCPSPTSITHGSVTYTITEATTLTITNCPCTVTKPVYSAPSASPIMPVYPVSSPVAPYPSANSTAPTAPAYMPPPTGTGSYTPPPASTSPIAPGYTGAANKASLGVAGLLAAAGLVAAL